MLFYLYSVLCALLYIVFLTGIAGDPPADPGCVFSTPVSGRCSWIGMGETCLDFRCFPRGKKAEYPVQKQGIYVNTGKFVFHGVRVYSTVQQRTG